MPPRPAFVEALRPTCLGDTVGAACDDEPSAAAGSLGKALRGMVSEGSTCYRTGGPDSNTPSASESSKDDLFGPQPKLRFQQATGSESWPTTRFPLSPRRPRPSFEELLLKDLSKHFVLERRLGAGSFGSVHRALCRRTGQRVAVKTVKLPEGKGSKDVDNEIKVASEFDHPHIVKLCGFFREAAARHIVMELCEGGDLRHELDRYVSLRKEVDPSYASGMASPMAAGYMLQALTAVAYLHHHGFVHRDIKPSNFLIGGTKRDKVLKLADFGYACRIGKSEVLSRRVGTWQYKAPEVHQGCYGQGADVWSLGVMCFRICTNRLPFPSGTREEYLNHVVNGQAEPCPEAWAGHVPQLRRLSLEMMTRFPEYRPCIRKILSNNAWLVAHGK